MSANDRQTSETLSSYQPEAGNHAMNKIITFVITCYVWTIVPLLTVFFSTAVVVAAPIAILTDKRRDILHEIATMWAKSVVWVNPWWTFVVEGRENLPADNRPVVYVANHQSQADIISVFLLSRQFRWLAKDSLFKVPFLGWAMSAAGYVPVKRGDRRSHAECMRRAKEHLSQGTSMLFFPEGTRSRDGQLQQFKAGAFRLAAETRADVVPITLQGASDLLPKGSITPSVATVRITIHPVISSNGQRDEELLLAAQKAIASALPNC